MTVTAERTPTWMQPVELPTTFTVDVTPQDIADGAGCSTEHCPVALALTRWLRARGFRFVNVSVAHLNAEIILDWRLPRLTYFHTAHEFINCFDACRPVEPMTVCFTRSAR